MQKKLFSIFLLCFFVVTLSGCWDLREIEKRGYVLGIALDTYDEAKNDIKPIDEMQSYFRKKKYVFTVQIPIWKLGQSSPTGGGGGGQKGQIKTWEMSVPGGSLLEMNRELSTRNDYPPFYEDMVVIIFSEKLARAGIRGLSDWLFRNHEIRRTVKIYIAEGKAKDLLDVTPTIESYSALYLSKIDKDNYRTSKFQNVINLGKLSEYLYAGADFHLTIVKHTKDEIKLARAGIIKRDRLVGILDEIKTEALNLLLDKYSGGVIVIPCKQHPNDTISIDVGKASTSIKPVIKGDKIEFQIKCKIDGSIEEVTCSQDHHLRSEDYINQVQQAVAKRVSDNLMATLKELQSMKADPIQLIEKIRIADYQFWKKNRKVWSDKYFPKVKFKINVKVDLLSTGLTD